MVKIRMTRGGATKRPFYRVVAVDERDKRDGRSLEFLGTYDPKSTPPAVKLDVEKVDAWVARGAQLSDTVRAILKQARLAAKASGSAA